LESAAQSTDSAPPISKANVSRRVSVGFIEQFCRL
jgi:hypothetical protein